MNRTRKLMTAVTTSLLITGTTLEARAVSASGQAAAQPDESWKTDPQVKDAANTINNWMVNCQHDATGDIDRMKMKAQEDVVKQFPQLDPALVQKALRYLVYKGEIRQMGNGSKENPFCYCETGSASG